MIARVKLYVEGTKMPFCEISMDRITKRKLDAVINNANKWLAIVTDQINDEAKKDLAHSRCTDLISILKYVLKVKNIKEFEQEKAAIDELVVKFSDLQNRSSLS